MNQRKVPAAQVGSSSVAASRLWLALVGIASLVLVTSVNRAAGALVPLPWLPDSCVASTLACLAVYLAIRPRRPFARPLSTTNWPRVRRLSVAWLVVWFGSSTFAALLAGHWIHYRLAETLPQVVAFVLMAPLQEELLFRGAIFELTERSNLGGSWVPILVSTACFSLHHLQLHGYAVTRGSLSQVAFAVPMGLVFGSLRAQTGSLWPPLAVHVFTNLPGAFGHRPSAVTGR